jgi:hypothetical protein
VSGLDLAQPDVSDFAHAGPVGLEAHREQTSGFRYRARTSPTWHPALTRVAKSFD